MNYIKLEKRLFIQEYISDITRELDNLLIDKSRFNHHHMWVNPHTITNKHLFLKYNNEFIGHILFNGNNIIESIHIKYKNNYHRRAELLLNNKFAGRKLVNI